MSFVLGVLGAILGVIIAIFIVGFIVSKKIQKELGISGVNPLKSIREFFKATEISNSTVPKSVNAMTILLEPQILRDFPDFNKEIIYSKIESDLKTIFNSIENLKLEKSSDLELINNALEQQIEDYKEQGVSIRYDNVVFHRHAIQAYTKTNGIATITTSSSLEYNYYDSRRKENSKYKTQTRYTCKYVYIYDVSKIPNYFKKETFILNCPNCGAPLVNLERRECVYCGAHIEEINLKTWKLASYEDDYEKAMI